MRPGRGMMSLTAHHTTPSPLPTLLCPVKRCNISATHKRSFQPPTKVEQRGRPGRRSGRSGVVSPSQTKPLHFRTTRITESAKAGVGPVPLPKQTPQLSLGSIGLELSRGGGHASTHSGGSRDLKGDLRLPSRDDSRCGRRFQSFPRFSLTGYGPTNDGTNRESKKEDRMLGTQKGVVWAYLECLMSWGPRGRRWGDLERVAKRLKRQNRFHVHGPSRGEKKRLMQQNEVLQNIPAGIDLRPQGRAAEVAGGAVDEGRYRD